MAKLFPKVSSVNITMLKFNLGQPNRNGIGASDNLAISGYEEGTTKGAEGTAGVPKNICGIESFETLKRLTPTKSFALTFIVSAQLILCFNSCPTQSKCIFPLTII